MKLTDIITNDLLTGVAISRDERQQLIDGFGELVPDWLLELLSDRNLAGSDFSLDDNSDQSGMGVELRWMTVEQMFDEASNFYPGIVAAKKGYLPFGICLEGSGDPYFLKIGKGHEDTCVVRIPHDAVIEEDIDNSRVEMVAPNLSRFFELSQREQ